MATSMLVNGAGGRLGQIAIHTISHDERLTLYGTCHRTNNLLGCIHATRPNIVLDVTVPSVVYQNAMTIIEAGVHPVIGTSGLDHRQIDTLIDACESRELSGAIIPNFSITAVLMIQFVVRAAKHLQHVEIIETHHASKVDAPSGTAAQTADRVSSVIEAPSPIPIHSVRLPGRVAHQEVLFGSEGETLSIKSDLIDRKAFGPGIAMACHGVSRMNRLVVGLDHFL